MTSPNNINGSNSDPLSSSPKVAGESLTPHQKSAETLALVHQRYSKYVAQLAARLVGGRDDVDAVVQDVFVDVMNHLNQLREPQALQASLKVLTVRRAIQRLRLRKVRQLLRLGGKQINYAEMVRSELSDAERTLVVDFYRALDKLPSDKRTGWILRHIESEPLENIAALCDCSLQTAKRWIASAQEGLEKELNAFGSQQL